MSGNDKIGDRVRITGAADFYQGEPELQVSKDGSGKDLVMLLGEGDLVEPAEGNAGGILNRSAEGKLVTRKGVVIGCETVNDRVRTIMVRGADGKTVRVFIDGCITAEQEAKNLAPWRGEHRHRPRVLRRHLQRAGRPLRAHPQPRRRGLRRGRGARP